MMLIADSGATKTHWVLIDGKEVIEEIYTPGFNPYYYEAGQFEESLARELYGKIPTNKVREIFFYGSGISSRSNSDIVINALQKIFGSASISVHHDLHGAAIALLGKNKGIACILGTGSNSCLWDGQEIIANVPSVGYMLGDEGSGTYMGKLLVRDILIGDADPTVAGLFYEETGLDFNKVLDRIYKEKDPNRFFASQSRFIRSNIHLPYCRKIVVTSFQDFIKAQLSKYDGFDSLPISFTGSIAANFQDILLEVMQEWNIRPGRIMKEPMEGMIQYHLEG
jgi:N-acetylglucosamine kinase-like BadF-type ATPase